MKFNYLVVFVVGSLNFFSFQDAVADETTQSPKVSNEKKKHKFTNRLINEKSPYLLQHAHNPDRRQRGGETRSCDSVRSFVSQAEGQGGKARRGDEPTWTRFELRQQGQRGVPALGSLDELSDAVEELLGVLPGRGPRADALDQVRPAVQAACVSVAGARVRAARSREFVTGGRTSLGS